MPSGQTHSTVTVLSSVGLALLPTDYSVALAIGCLSGMILTPDLDIDGYTETDGFVRRSIGKYPMLYWRAIWNPYRIGVKHRSFWSHTPLIGTLARLVYLFFPLIINIIKDQDSTRDLKVGALSIRSQLLVLPFWLLMPSMAQYIGFAIWFIVGLAISDILHWLADTLF